LSFPIKQSRSIRSSSVAPSGKLWKLLSPSRFSALGTRLHHPTDRTNADPAKQPKRADLVIGGQLLQAVVDNGTAKSCVL